MASMLDPDGSFGRFDLPVRDVLRFIIPGGYAAISLAVIDDLLFNKALGIADSSILIPVGFIFGLFAFTVEFHKRIPPWRKRWNSEMRAIRKEIKAITLYEFPDEKTSEERSKPIYKLWIEAFCPADLRAYLHYKTGIYYSAVAVSVYSALGAAFCGVRVLLLYLALTNYPLIAYINRTFESGIIKSMTTELVKNSNTEVIIVGILCILFFAIMSRLSYLMSRSYLKEVTEQGLIIMSQGGNRDAIKGLALAAIRTSGDLSDARAVNEIVRHELSEICPIDVDLLKKIHQPQIVDQADVRNAKVKKVAHITIEAKKPLELNGCPNLYESERQRILESSIAMRLCSRLNVQAVRVQIGPIEDYSNNTYHPSNKKIHAVTLQRALELKLIENRSSVENCCRKYEINKILLRGRYVIGPSPELAEVLEKELPKQRPGLRVYDPFAGTRMVEKICKQHFGNAEVLSQDRIDLDGNESNFDSFAAAPPTEEYDLAIIDPLYEDCLAYIELVLPKLKVKKLIVQCGRVCDVDWNDKIRKVLERNYTVETPVLFSKVHNSCLFVATKF